MGPEYLYGNVWKWCDDRHNDPVIGEFREPALWGGGWRNGPSHCMSQSRNSGGENYLPMTSAFALCAALNRSAENRGEAKSPSVAAARRANVRDSLQALVSSATALP